MSSAAELIARTLALQQTTTEILTASARISRQILGTDSTFMAVADGTGAYPMSITDGIRDPQFREITVRPATGLGGQVLLRGRPHRVADYVTDPTISRDFVHVVCDVEGLHGMACVPVNGPDRIEALLYTGTRTAGPPPDQMLRTLELVAAHAELSLHAEAVRKQETELAVLRERQNIATQLHDSVAQMLFTIGVAARHARRQGDLAAVTAALEEIESTAAQARRELRASLHRLSEPAEGLAFEARLSGEAACSNGPQAARSRSPGGASAATSPSPSRTCSSTPPWRGSAMRSSTPRRGLPSCTWPTSATRSRWSCKPAPRPCGLGIREKPTRPAPARGCPCYASARASCAARLS